MSPTLTDVFTAAESLSATERRELVDLLLDTLDEAREGDDTPTLSMAWQEEVSRRSAEYDAGKAATITWEQVQAGWRSRRPTDG